MSEPNFTVSLKTEIDRYGAVHVVTSIIPDVLPVDTSAVRDELLSRRATALRELSDHPRPVRDDI